MFVRSAVQRVGSKVSVRTSSMMGLQRVPRLMRSTVPRRSFGFRPSYVETMPVEALPTEAAKVFDGIVRHGPGDGLIILNVGGQEFKTLRSTVATNTVLARHVAKAEANAEIAEGKAIFIDRDPSQFGLILTFLRNKVEGITYNSRYGQLIPNKSPQYIRLPEGDALKDLFVEAAHYRIPELLDQICHHTFFLELMSNISPGGNPFLLANNFVRVLRTGALTLAGGGSLLAILTADFEHFTGIKLSREVKTNFLGVDEKEVEALETNLAKETRS